VGILDFVSPDTPAKRFRVSFNILPIPPFFADGTMTRPPPGCGVSHTPAALPGGFGLCPAVIAESKPDIQLFPRTAAAFFFCGQLTRSDLRNVNDAMLVNAFDPLALSIGAPQRFARQKKSRLVCQGMPVCGAGHIITPPSCRRTQ
jgi:hypothetical protein